MKTQSPPTNTIEENINNASGLYNESISAMTEIYNKQFQLGYDMFNDFMKTRSETGKNDKGFGNQMFFTGIEAMQKQFENISEQSKKAMSAIMNSFNMNQGDKNQQMSKSIFDNYKLFAEQIEGVNKGFYKTFNDTFKTANEDADKLYTIFRKNTETNFMAAEEAINTAMKTFNSIATKSGKDVSEMQDSINKQMELITKSNLKMWSDFLQTKENVNEKENGKEGKTNNNGKENNTVNKTKSTKK